MAVKFFWTGTNLFVLFLKYWVTLRRLQYSTSTCSHKHMHMYFIPFWTITSHENLLMGRGSPLPGCCSEVFMSLSSQFWAANLHLAPPPWIPAPWEQSSQRGRGVPARPPAPGSARCFQGGSWWQRWPTGWWLKVIQLRKSSDFWTRIQITVEASTQMYFEWGGGGGGGGVRHYKLSCGSAALLVLYVVEAQTSKRPHRHPIKLHSNKQIQVLSNSIPLFSVTQTAETKPVERCHKVAHAPS